MENNQSLISDFSSILTGIHERLTGIEEKVTAVEGLLTQSRYPSGTIVVWGKITQVRESRRSGVKNISLREADETHRYLKISASVPLALAEGQSIWVRGKSEIDKQRMGSKRHIIYVDTADNIKVLENG